MDVTAIYPPLTKNNIYAVLVLTSALFSRYHSSSSNTNEAIFRKTEGHRFIYGRITSSTVPSSVNCALKCLQNPQCFSYNLQEANPLYSCELNNSTSETRPNGLVQCKGYSYYEIRLEFGQPEVGNSSAVVSPVNEDWSMWGTWSNCTKCCGGGTQYRTRTCPSPPPGNGGANCPGTSQETRDCFTHTCKVDCSVQGHGNYHAHETDCSRYYQCSHGRAYCKQCGGGRYWKTTHPTGCVHSYNVQCTNGVSRP